MPSLEEVRKLFSREAAPPAVIHPTGVCHGCRHFAASHVSTVTELRLHNGNAEPSLVGCNCEDCWLRRRQEAPARSSDCHYHGCSCEGFTSPLGGHAFERSPHGMGCFVCGWLEEHH